jgi:hypothetical protein
MLCQVTLLLPDELGEFLQMGSLHWLCAGQLSLQTTVSRAIWSAPLAADTPESKLARQLLNIHVERLVHSRPGRV